MLEDRQLLTSGLQGLLEGASGEGFGVVDSSTGHFQPFAFNTAAEGEALVQIQGSAQTASTAATPCQPSEICVKATGGLGDVIEVNLATHGGSDFSDMSAAIPGDLGRVFYLNLADVSAGRFYFVPNLLPQESSVVVTFTRKLTPNDQTKETDKLQINIRNGFSAFALDGSVGVGGENKFLDVLKVEQRLKYLGFPGYGDILPGPNTSAPPGGQDITVDGFADELTEQAIKLFQATLARGRNPFDPATADGRINKDQATHLWLNASNAPSWRELLPKSGITLKPSSFDGGIQEERFGTSWVINVIEKAATRPLMINGISDRYGDTGPDIHPSSHKAGLDFDVNIDQPILRAEMASAQSAGRKSDPPSLPNGETGAWYRTQLKPAEIRVVDDIEAVVAAAGSLYRNLLVGSDAGLTATVNGQTIDLTYPWIRKVLQVELPSGLENTVSNATPHQTHFHVQINPPLRGPAATLDNTATLPSADGIINAFNIGVRALRQAGQLLSVVNAGLGADLPIIGETAASIAAAGDRFALPFANDLQATGGTIAAAALPITTTTDSISNQLDSFGFQVQYIGTSPDGYGDYLRAKYERTWTTASAPLSFDGHTGFDYFDAGVQGSLGGSVSASLLPVTLSVTIGVDMTNGTPSFYVGEDSVLTIGGISISGQANANLAIRNLLDVDIKGPLVGNLSGALAFADGDGDDKLRVEQFANPLSIIKTSLAGSLSFDPTLKAKLPIIGEVSWGGSWKATLVNGVINIGPPTLNSPSTASIEQLLKAGYQAIAGAFNLFDGIKLGGASLPVIGKPLGELLGLPSFLTGGGLGVSGFSLNVTPQTVTDLINGKLVDLIRFEQSGGDHYEKGFSVPILAAAVPLGPIPLTATLSFSTELSLGWNYYIGMGVDTAGFYIDPGTSVSASGSIQAGLSANVSLAGILGMGVTSGVGAGVNLAVGLHDPDPRDGKIYLDELLTQGAGSLGRGLYDAAQVNVGGEAYAFARGVVSFLFWDWEVFNTRSTIASFGGQLSHNNRSAVSNPNSQRNLTGRAPFVDQLLPDSLLSNGVLTIDARNPPNANLSNTVSVTAAGNGAVKVQWGGVGQRTYAAGQITKIVYEGNDQADRVYVGPAVTAEVVANARGGNDVITVTDAVRSTISGGSGVDLLAGGSGKDTISGGIGNDTITSGGANDILHGDDGDDRLDAGAGDDTVFGDSGQDVIKGGSENDVIDGGTDSDQIYGGTGDDTLDGGADNSNDMLFGEQGKDTLRGGGGNDTVVGGTGDDTLYGGEGEDLIYGDRGDPTPDPLDGNDHLYGQAGKDRLFGEAGNDVLEGDDAGDNPAGDDLLVGDDGNDTLNGRGGKDTIEGGAGTDTVLGGDGDDLINGGSGADMLQGEAGNDVFQLDFASADGTLDTMKGGLGKDTIFVSGTTSTQIVNGLPQTSDNFDDFIQIEQVSGDAFQATNRDPITASILTTFKFSIDSSVNGDVEQLGIQGLGGNDRLEVITGPLSGKNMLLDGGAGNDTLIGNDGRDILKGGPGDDHLFGNGNDDTLYGDEGNDRLDGGEGVDYIDAGAGGDTVLGGYGREIIRGGDGDDFLVAGSGFYGSIISGGLGNDTIIGSSGIDSLDGEDGNDVVLGGDLGDNITGGPGNDLLIGELGRDDINGNSDDDVIYTYINNDERARLGLPLIAELNLDERQTRTNKMSVDNTNLLVLQQSIEFQQLYAIPVAQRTQAQQEKIENLEDAITVTGLLLSDLLQYQSIYLDKAQGGSGQDVIYGSPNFDILDGQEGDDEIHASGGYVATTQKGDVIKGGDGTDVLWFDGTNGDDVIKIYAQLDSANANWRVVVDLNNDGVVDGFLQEVTIENIGVRALNGDDTISIDFGNLDLAGVKIDAGPGNDDVNATGLQSQVTLMGGPGNDRLVGGEKNDTIEGDSGDDVIEGGLGDDLIFGGDGNDFIHGDAGDDAIFGGLGNDSVDGGPGANKIYDPSSAVSGAMPIVVESTAVNTTTTRSLTFSHVLTINSLTTNNFQVFAAGSTVPLPIAGVAQTVDTSSGRSTVVISFPQPLAPGDYELVAKGSIRDTTGEHLNGTTEDIDPNGPTEVAYRWASRAGSTANDYSTGISALPDGSAIVTGFFGGTVTFGSKTLTSNGTSDIFVARMNSDGTFAWALQAGGSGSDQPNGISALSDGSSIIIGGFTTSITFGSTTLSPAGRDVFIAKVNSNGAFAWAVKAGGSLSDIGNGVAMTSDGGAIVTGRFDSSATFGGITLSGSNPIDIFIAKVNSNGAFAWAIKAGGSEADIGSAVSVLSDGSGAIVTGSFSGLVTFGSKTLISSGLGDVFVAKVTANGAFAWAERAGGASADNASSVSALADGSAIITGSFDGTATFGNKTLSSSGFSDIFVAKINANGTFVWAAKAGGASFDSSADVSTFSDGSAILTGYFYETATFGNTSLTSSGVQDEFVAKIDKDGKFTWATKAGGKNADFGTSIAAVADGSAIVAGGFNDVVAFGDASLTSAGIADVFIARVKNVALGSDYVERFVVMPPPVQLGGPIPPLPLANAPIASPAAAINPLDGSYVVAWQGPGASANDVDIFTRQYTASGTPLTAIQRVNVTTAGNQASPAVAMDASGNYSIVWQQSTGALMARRFNADGTPLYPDADQRAEIKVNQLSTAGNPEHASVAMDSAGDFVVTWSYPGTNAVYARRFFSSGSAIDNEFRVDKINAESAQIAYGPSVAMDSTGNFVVAWQTTAGIGNGTGIYGRWYQAAGNGAISTTGDRAIISNSRSSETDPTVAMNIRGEATVAWSVRGAKLIEARRFDTAGRPAAATMQPSSGETDTPSTPRVAVDADGNVSIVWNEGSGYKSAWFDAWGNRLVIDRAVTNSTAPASLAGAPDGDFVVMWPKQLDANTYGIAAVRYTRQQPTVLGVTTSTDNKKVIVAVSQAMAVSGAGNVLDPANWAIKLPDGHYLAQRDPTIVGDDPRATPEQFGSISFSFNATANRWEVELPIINIQIPNYILPPGNYEIVVRQGIKDAAGRPIVPAINRVTGQATVSASAVGPTPATATAQVTVTDSSSDSFQPIIIPFTRLNSGPAFTSPSVVTAVENSLDVVTIAAADSNNDRLTYSLTGADAIHFDLNAISGKLAFKQAPNFEVPTDTDKNNVYLVTVTVTDGDLSASIDLTIGVLDVNEGPTVTSGANITIADGQTYVLPITASDPEKDAGILAISGVDASLFSIDASGIISFRQPPSFQAPDDYGTDNVYNITVQVSDGAVAGWQNLAITVIGPSFTVNKPVQTSFDEDAVTHGPALQQVVANWATKAANLPIDAGQLWRFHITTDNPSLFTILPTIDDSGTLSYTPKPNAHGTATVTLTLQDEAGIATTTVPQRFTIDIVKRHKLHNASEFGNRNGLDVTGSTSLQPDGFIVAGDVVAVINYINAKGSGRIAGNAIGPPYYDVDGDDEVVAHDVIRIINWINAHPGQSEGESSYDGLVDSMSAVKDATPSTVTTVAVAAAVPPVIPVDLMSLLAADVATAQFKRRRATT